MAAAAASPVTEISTWLSGDIVYEVLHPTLLVHEDYAVLFDAKEVKTNRLLTVKKYYTPPGIKGALLKRMIDYEREIIVAVRGGPHVIASGTPFWNKRTRRMEMYMEHYQHRLSLWMDETLENRALQGITIQIAPFYHTLLTQMLSALKYIHSKDIIHCCVIPQNIVYNNHNHFVLSEFSLARHAHKRPYVHPGLITAHMAPEVLDKKEISFTTDIWTLGIVLLDLLLAPALGGDTSCFKSDGICKNLSELAAELGQHCEMPELVKMLKMSPTERTSASDLLEYIKRHPRPQKPTQEVSIGVLYRYIKLMYPDEDDAVLRTMSIEQYALCHSGLKASITTSLTQGNVGAVPVQQDPPSSSGQNSAAPSITRGSPSEPKPQELRQEESPKESLLQNPKASLLRQSLTPGAAGASKVATTAIETNKGAMTLSYRPQELVTSIAESAKIPPTTRSLEMGGETSKITPPCLTESQAIASPSASLVTISSAASQRMSASSSATSKKRRKSGRPKRKGRTARDEMAIDLQDVSSTQRSQIHAPEVPEAGDGSDPMGSSCVVFSDSEGGFPSRGLWGERQEPICEEAESVREKTRQALVRQAEKPGSIQQGGLQVEQATGSGSHQASALLSAHDTGGHVRLTDIQGPHRAGESKLEQQRPSGKKESEDQEAARARETIEAHEALSAGQKAAKAPGEAAASAREKEAVKAREEIAAAGEAIRAQEETPRAIKAARGVEATRHRVNTTRAQEVRQEAAKAKEEAARVPEAVKAREAARAKEIARNQKLARERKEAARVQKAVAEREARENDAITKATTTQVKPPRIQEAVQKREQRGESVEKSKPTGVLRTDVIQGPTMAPKKRGAPPESSMAAELIGLKDREKMTSTLPRARSTPDLSLILREQEILDALEAISSCGITGHSDITGILKRPGVLVGMPGNADATKALVEDAGKHIYRALKMMRVSSHARASEWQPLIRALAKEPINFSVISFMTRRQDETTRSRQAALQTPERNAGGDPIQGSLSEEAASNKTEPTQSREVGQTDARREFSTPMLSARASAWDSSMKCISPWGAIYRAYVEDRLPPVPPARSTDAEKYQAWLDAELPAPPLRPHPEGVIYDLWARRTVRLDMHNFSDILEEEAQRYYAHVRGEQSHLQGQVAQDRIQQARPTHVAQRPVNSGLPLDNIDIIPRQAGLTLSSPSIPTAHYKSLQQPGPHPSQSASHTFLRSTSSPSGRPFRSASAQSPPSSRSAGPEPRVESQVRERPGPPFQGQIRMVKSKSTGTQQVTACLPGPGAETPRQRAESQAGPSRLRAATRKGPSYYTEGAPSQIDPPIPMPRPADDEAVKSMRRKWEMAQKLRRDHLRILQKMEAKSSI